MRLRSQVTLKGSENKHKEKESQCFGGGGGSHHSKVTSVAILPVGSVGSNHWEVSNVNNNLLNLANIAAVTGR